MIRSNASLLHASLGEYHCKELSIFLKLICHHFYKHMNYL